MRWEHLAILTFRDDVSSIGDCCRLVEPCRRLFSCFVGSPVWTYFSLRDFLQNLLSLVEAGAFKPGSQNSCFAQIVIRHSVSFASRLHLVKVSSVGWFLGSREAIMGVLQSSWEMRFTDSSASSECVDCFCRTWNKTSGGTGEYWDVAFASSSTSLFCATGMYLSSWIHRNASRFFLVLPIILPVLALLQRSLCCCDPQ